MALVGDTIGTFTAALKEYYSPDVVKQLQFKDQPFFAMVRKDNSFVGLDYYRVPVEYASPAGTSLDWSQASNMGLASSMKVTEFRVSRTKTHQIGYIQSELLLAAADKVGAFMDAATRQVDSNMLALSRDIGISMFRDGWGSRGRIKPGSTVAGQTTIYLEAVSDAHNFEVGQILDVVLTANYGGNGGTNAAETLGTDTSQGKVNTMKISGIDHTAGTLTFGVAVDNAVYGVPTIAHSAYLGLRGMMVPNSVGNTLVGPDSANKIAGLKGWLPNANPGPTYTWYQCQRSADSRLSGLRYDASAGIPIVEAMTKGAQLVREFGGKASHMFCSFNTYGDIINALETKVRYVDRNDGEIGFNGIEVVTPSGIIEVFADVNCPDANAYMLELDSWKLCSLKDAIVGMSYDGGTSIELQPYEAGDAYRLRLVNRGNLACTAPSHNCNIILA
jgi:hypothetical protein